MKQKQILLQQKQRVAELELEHRKQERKQLMNKKANGIQLVKTKLTNNNMGQNYINFLD